MPHRQPDVLTISSPSDVVCTVVQILGFMPSESFVAACTRGPRHRFGLVLRFDLELAADPDPFAAAIDGRARHAGADGVFLVVFTDDVPVGGELPHRDLIDAVVGRLRELVLDVLLVAGDRWWSYLCDEPRCCGPDGTPVDHQSPGATALAAAYALAGQGVLPNREALVRSVAYDGSDPDAMRDRIETLLRCHARQSLATRRLALQVLIARLGAELTDPRGTINDDDAAELAALCEDPVVRDEVLIRAVKRRRRKLLLRILRDVACQVPPPYDAAICAALAWVAYADGDGAVANVALERALSSDPDYSLARLTIDSLDRQIPPEKLLEVMREAGRALRSRSAAG